MKIVVYCSSVDDLPEDWQEAARLTGEWIGRNGYTLVYGGVHSGLMRVVAQSTKDAGGEVVGIVPARRRDMASSLNDVQVPTSDLNDRKGVMQMLGDAYVVLPGGYGTLDEFTTSFSYLNFTRQRRPVIVVNMDGIFTPVLSQLSLMADKGLMKPDNLAIVTEVRSCAELAEALESLRE